MSPAGDTTDSADEHLAEGPLREYLGSDESVAALLTNVHTGVERDGERIRPGEDCGAVAAVTDRRTLFLVGAPPALDGDYAASVPHDDVGTVTSETEALTASLVLDTPAETWRFTARDHDAVDAAVAAVEDRLADGLLDRARDHRDRAEAVDDERERIEALEDALVAFREAAAALGSENDGDREREARADAEAVIADLVAAHRALAADRREAGEWELAADNEASARELFTEARSSLDRALELAEAYPPGDADAIADERAAVADRLSEDAAESADCPVRD